MGLEPEETEQEEEPAPKSKTRPRKPSAAPKAGASPKASSKGKRIPQSEGGRSVNTEYYNHNSLEEMPEPRLCSEVSTFFGKHT